MSTELLTWASTYIIIILCELGDKTQVVVLLFTSKNPRRRWGIFAASSLALVLCVLTEVTIGVTLARYIGPALINRAAGVMFLLLGLIGLIRVFKVFERLSFRRQQKTCLETE
ncbi:MAG: TMEM165/GDT1 family protein [Syntrophomonadaceae bacterium]|jgi:putative Ca2+/H+ antiporter (TMEM165/GDT1 family)|nr:TMEM165/GDT1 family protein [Bacillota bacterium]